MFKNYLVFLVFVGITACGQSEGIKQSSVKAADTVLSLGKDKKMDTVFFWNIMDRAFSRAGFDNKLRENAILDQLTQLTPEQIQTFEIIFQQMNQKASTWNNIAAHTIIEGGSSDDTFYYFRCWLISLGQKHFYGALEDPDYLASLDIPINKKYGYGEVIFEELIPISDRAYSIVTGKKSEDESFPRAFAHNKGLFFDSHTDMKGKEWAEEDLPKIAPKLYKKFNKN